MTWLLFGLALADTLVVDPFNPEAYPNIAAAIAASASGDTIAVTAGTYAECLDTGGRSITIAGAGADSTVIDGTGLCGDVVRIGEAEEVVLSDLAVTNADGRGIEVYWSELVLERVKVFGSGHSDLLGGGLAAEGGEVSLYDCLFEGNRGSYGGAVYLAWYSVLTDNGSTFLDNAAYSGGGGVYAGSHDTLSFVGTVFDSNATAAGSGGGLAAIWSDGLGLDGVTFQDNTAAGAGGGAALSSVEATVAIQGAEFVSNVAGSGGGGLSVEWHTDLVIDDSRFTSNVAGDRGGAIQAYALEGFDLRHSRLCTNQGARGGALATERLGAEQVSNNLFVENAAEHGGALYRQSFEENAIWNNTFVGNTASTAGGAFYTEEEAPADLRNNIVAASTGTAVYAEDAGAARLAYNGWSDNVPTDAGGALTVAHDVDGNVVADPGFVAYSVGGCEDDDLRLAAGSAFCDAGDPALLDPDGTRSDLGAWGGPDALESAADGVPGCGDVEPEDTDAQDTDPCTEGCDSAEVVEDSALPADSVPPELEDTGGKPAGCGCSIETEPRGLVGLLAALLLVGLSARRP